MIFSKTFDSLIDGAGTILAPFPESQTYGFHSSPDWSDERMIENDWGHVAGHLHDAINAVGSRRGITRQEEKQGF